MGAGPGFNAWYDARQINKDIQELENSQEYLAFDEAISLLEKQLEEVKEEHQSFMQRVIKVSQDKEDLLAQIEIVKENLSNWQAQCKTLT